MAPNVVSFALAVAERVFLQPWLWFSHLLTSSGMTGIFLAAFAMFLSFKFLVAPVMGQSFGAGSDKSERKERKE